MKNATRVVLCAGLLGFGSAASGQTFVSYFLDGVNLTDSDRGTGSARAGDVIRMSLRVEHDGLSYAGGKVEMLYSGVRSSAITMFEDSFGFPHEPWELGRSSIYRIVASDGPADATFPHNIDVEALGDGVGKMTDVNDDFFDFASTPPGLGGLGAAFPTRSGDQIYVFDYVFDGGQDLWDAGHNGRARMWRDASDINGIVVEARSGATFVVSPSPGVLVVAGIGLLGAGRRRCGA